MEQNFKSKKIIIMLSFVLFFLSCQRDKAEKKTTDYNNGNNKILSFKFPDTVKLNKVVKGTLHYDITNIGFDKDIISSRFLTLILNTSKKEKLLTYDQMEKDYLLGFIDSIPTGKFNIGLIFDKRGKQILNIAIRDNMFLKPDKNTPTDKMTLRTSDCSFSKEVYVED